VRSRRLLQNGQGNGPLGFAHLVKSEGFRRGGFWWANAKEEVVFALRTRDVMLDPDRLLEKKEYYFSLVHEAARGVGKRDEKALKIQIRCRKLRGLETRSATWGDWPLSVPLSFLPESGRIRQS